MIMRTIIMSALLGLSVLAGVSVSASAADCKVAGWTDSVPGHTRFSSAPEIETTGEQLATTSETQSLKALGESSGLWCFGDQRVRLRGFEWVNSSAAQ